jgi:recombination protein RecA
MMAPTLAPSDRDGPRQQALTVALTGIERRFGRGAVWSLGAGQPIAPTPAIPTGSLPLDVALGVGGLPRGRITEIYGPEASGKTTLALSVIAQAQRTGGTALFVDAEHALDLKWTRTVGVDLDRLLLSQPDHAEQALGVVEVLVRSGALDVVVLDSVPALVPRREIDGEMGESTDHLQSLLLAQAMRKLSGAIAKTRTAVIFCNQLREDPGQLVGDPEYVPGGRALKHHAAVRLDLRPRNDLKAGNQVVGTRLRARVAKSKVAIPWRTAQLDLRFDLGIDHHAGLFELALAHEEITKTDGTYACQRTPLGRSRQQAVQRLRAAPALTVELERRLRARLGLPSASQDATTVEAR